MAQQLFKKVGQQMLTKIGQQMLMKIGQQLFHTIETDGRLAGANQQMSLTYTIETDGRRPHNRNRWLHNSRATAFCHAWPILLSALVAALISLLVCVCMH